jgi:hypothetical protein
VVAKSSLDLLLLLVLSFFCVCVPMADRLLDLGRLF